MAAIVAVPVSGRPNKPLPQNRTDSHLIALAVTELVITDDRKQIRRWGTGLPGLIPWLDIEAARKQRICLLEVLRDRATRLPGGPAV